MTVLKDTATFAMDVIIVSGSQWTALLSTHQNFLGVDPSKEDVKMTSKECLIQFKQAYCEKDPKNNKDPEFRCDKCLFRQDDNCLINAFISRQFEKED